MKYFLSSFSPNATYMKIAYIIQELLAGSWWTFIDGKILYLQHYYPDANIPGRSAASCRSILNHIPLPLLVVTPRAVLAFSRTLLNIHECDVIRHDALATYGCLDESDNDEGSIQLNVRDLSLIDKWIHFMVLSAYRTEVYSLGQCHRFRIY